MFGYRRRGNRGDGRYKIIRGGAVGFDGCSSRIDRVGDGERGGSLFLDL